MWQRAEGILRFLTKARLSVVVLFVVALLAMMPVTSPTVEGSRLVNTFADGNPDKVVFFDPYQVETLEFLLRKDVTVTQAVFNLSANLLTLDTPFILGAGVPTTGQGIDVSGDVDNDGHNDLLLSIPGNNGNTGRMDLLWGTATGITFNGPVTVSGTAQHQLMGYDVSTGGDLNGDGYDEIVGGAIQMDMGTTTGTGVGTVHIVWGSDRPNTTADRTLSVGSNGDMFGFSVSTHGDINNDGYDDIIVGAPRHIENQNNPGRAYVFLSSASGPNATSYTTLNGTVNGDAFGFDVHICGDVNDDGYQDVLVGAPLHNGTNASDYDLGRVYLFLGKSDGVETDPTWTYTGNTTRDLLGYSVSGAGDVNGDGYDDVAVAVPLEDPGTRTDAGAVLIFHGGSGGLSSTPDAIIVGTSNDEVLGAEVANLYDMDADGYGDIIIGAPGAPNGSTAAAGAVYLHFGAPTGLDTRAGAVLRGDTADSPYGASVAMGGDIDGDGHGDFALTDTASGWGWSYFGGAGGSDPEIYLEDVQLFSHTGMFRSETTVADFASHLNAYMAAHQGDADINGNILVTLNLTTSNQCELLFDNINIIIYRLVQPTGLTATPVAEGNSIKLKWDRHDTKQDDISKMSIEMWNGTGWEEVIKVAKNVEEYVVTGLTDGVEYRFRLRAFDGGVQKYSEPSLEVTATPKDTKAPSKIIDVTTAEDRDLMGINISWAPSDPDVINYELWTNKTGEWQVLSNVSAPQTWYVDTDVMDGPKYYYRVRGWDEVLQVGEYSAIRSGILSDLDPPVTPTGLRVETVPTGRALRVVWDLNTDDTVSYSVKSNWTGAWKEIGSKPQGVNFLIHTGLVDGKTYYYRISALDEVKNEAEWSEIVSGVPVDETPPSIPTGLEVEARPMGNTLRVRWILNTDDTDQYEVQVYDPGESGWVTKATVARETNQCDIGGLTDSVTYRIRIRAIDKAGIASEFSSEVTGVPVDTLYPRIPTGVRVSVIPEGKILNVSWDANNDDTVLYRLYQWSPDDKDWREVQPGPGPEPWYLVVGLRNNVPYAFVIRAVDEAGNESPNSVRVEDIPRDTVPPAQPRFEGLATITNQKDIEVSGVCEPGATVVLFVRNLASAPETCDAQGRFSFPVRLNSGPNEIYAQASDDSGVTVDSARVTIRVDLDGPEVERTDPLSETTGVSRTNFTFEVYFSEELRSGSILCFIRKGKVYEIATLMQNKDSADNIVPRLTEYDRIRSVARYTVETQLEGDQGYTIVIHGAEDLAGNALAHPSNAYAFVVQTAQAGGGGGGGGGGDEGLGSAALIGAAIIIILVIILVLFFIIRSTGTKESIEVDMEVMATPKAREPTPEEARPDIGDLYAQAYTERGEEEAREHAEVEGGIGDWLAEQERHSTEAEEETKRLVAEMATKGGPPGEDSGPIDELPPGLVEETQAVRESLGVETILERPSEEPSEEPGEEPGEEADEEAEEDSDEASKVLDELEEELESEEEDKEG